MKFSELAEHVLNGEGIDRDMAREIIRGAPEDFPSLIDTTYKVRHFYHGNRVKLCMLLNAQSGLCPEDCFYCSQSSVSTAPIQKYRLLSPPEMVEKARAAVFAGARRFCIVCSGTGPTDRQIDQIGTAVRLIKSEFPDLEICTSLGIMDQQKAEKLKEVGVGWINHNLNTSERFYPQICTTHTYQDRVDTVQNVQAAGLSTCSGGIIGMGETIEDILDFAFAVQEMNIDSIPINFLHPIDGTPFGERPLLHPLFGLRILCLIRLMNPRKEVRAAGGREMNLGGLQGLCLYAANSIFVEGYLTTPGLAARDTIQMIRAMGFEPEEVPASSSIASSVI